MVATACERHLVSFNEHRVGALSGHSLADELPDLCGRCRLRHKFLFKCLHVSVVLVNSSFTGDTCVSAMCLPTFVRSEAVANHFVPVELSATASWILIGVAVVME